MNIKRFNNEVKLPTKSHSTDAGFDLYLPEDIKIKPFATICIGLGIGIEVPKGYAAMLVPRSSTSLRGLISQTAIIDSGYTGEIHLVLTNCSNTGYSYEKGSRLVSLVIYKLLDEDLIEVDDFKTSERGSCGLGSTGA